MSNNQLLRTFVALLAIGAIKIAALTGCMGQEQSPVPAGSPPLATLPATDPAPPPIPTGPLPGMPHEFESQTMPEEETYEEMHNRRNLEAADNLRSFIDRLCQNPECADLWVNNFLTMTEIGSIPVENSIATTGLTRNQHREWLLEEAMNSYLDRRC